MDPKNNLKKLVKKATYQTDPSSAVHSELMDQTDHLETIAQGVQNLNEAIKSTIVSPEEDMALLKGFRDTFRGPEGKQGEPGKTPVKGTDYFTPQEVQDIVQQSTPVKGQDYFTPQEVLSFKNDVTPIKGVHYNDGKDGKDGRDGKDGAPGQDGKPGIDGKDGRDALISADKVIEMVKGKLDVSHLKNYQTLKANRMGGAGVTKIVAGSGISISSRAPAASGLGEVTITGSGASIGGTVTGGTTGSILFINPTNTLAQDNSNLFWDDTNNRLGIGISAPTVPFHVSSASPTADYVARFINSQGTRALGILIQSNTASGTTTDPMLKIAAGANTTLLSQTDGKLGINTGSLGLNADLVVGGSGGSNTGFEIVVGSGIVAQAFNRNTSAYATLNFDGSSVGFRPNGSIIGQFTTTGETLSGNLTLNATSPTVTTALNDTLVVSATHSGGIVSLQGGNSLNFRSAATSRWNIDSSGHFMAATDNTYDIGASGATRPRSIYAGTNINAGGQLQCTSLLQVGFGGGTPITVESSGGGGALYTQSSAKYMLMGAGTSGGATTVATFGATHATTPNIIQFTTASTARWNVDSSGHLVAATDGSYDIGASGATRPRNVYVQNSIIPGQINFGASRAIIKSSGDGIVNLFNNAETDFTRINLGGTTSSFPSLKKSGTQIQFILADDSTYAGIRSTYWSGLSGSVIRNATDGVFTLLNAAETDFTRLNFGGTTSSFPAIKRNSTGIDFRLADDSAYTFITASTIELGAASDTTLSRSSAGVLAVEGVVIPSISSTNTLTNKRVTMRLVSVNAPGATPTTNTDNCDIAEFTGLGTAITSMTTNLSGTPVNGDMLEFIFLDDGTARGITWGTSFANGGLVNLPTTTVISTVLRVLVQYQTAATLNKWVCIAVA